MPNITISKKINNISNSSHTSSSDPKAADSTASEIFQAQIRRSPVYAIRPSEAIARECRGCILTAVKIIFFPIIYLYLLSKYAARKLAFSYGVGASRAICEVQRSCLLELGGEETVLICSGSHQSYEHYVVPQVDALLQMGHPVMVFNYRGFGKSEGSPSEEGFNLDAEAAYQYIQSEKSNSVVVALGYSMGGAPATDLAAAHSDVDLFLDRSFSSMKDVAGTIGGFVAKWIFQFGDASFDLTKKIHRVQGNILIARGTHDEIMSPSHLKQLKASLAAHPKTTFIEVNSPHHHSSNASLWFHPENDQNQEGQLQLRSILGSAS